MRDSHKSRSVRSLSVHACSAPVHELTELRSRPELWQRVHAARLMPGQKELVVVLDPPVAATCLSVSCIPPVPPPVMLREGFVLTTTTLSPSSLRSLALSLASRQKAQRATATCGRWAGSAACSSRTPPCPEACAAASDGHAMLRSSMSRTTRIWGQRPRRRCTARAAAGW